jgi:hypothetical protein
VGAFAALVALLAGLVRFYGWSAERWSRRVGAAISEAGGRTADFALEFWDWLRLGR